MTDRRPSWWYYPSAIASGAILTGAVYVGVRYAVDREHTPSANVVVPLSQDATQVVVGADYGSVRTVCVGEIRLFVSKDDTQATSALAAVHDPNGCPIEGSDG